MKLNIFFLIIFLAIGILFSSCIKKEEYPFVTHIEYVDFTKIQNSLGIDEKGILKISFTDGDGDIGLAPGDTFGPFSRDSAYYYNFFIKYFEKQKGIIKEIELPFPNNSRIPFLTPSGKNKALKGDIEITLFINNPLTTYDTILFQAYIVDRALHKSNVISTPEIKVKKQ